MRCWPEDAPEEREEARERRACSELGWAAGIFAVAYLITLFVWRLCR